MFWLFAGVLLSLAFVVLNHESYDFGPYKFNWQKYETCKGPKKGDCGKVTLENLQNMSDVIFVLDFSKDCPVTKAKVTISNKQMNSTKKMWNYSLDSPCQHFVLGPILKESFNLSNTCKVSKGYYRIHVNINDKAASFLGSSFFYGNYAFKVLAHNKINNFFCIYTDLGVERLKP